MNILNTTLISLFRKKQKIFLILLILLLFSLISLICCGIYYATNKSIQNLENSLGGSFTVAVKHFTKEERPDLYKPYIASDGKEFYYFYSKVMLTDEIVDSINKVDGIEKSNKESYILPYLENISLKEGLGAAYISYFKGEKVYESGAEIGVSVPTIYTVNNSNLYSYFRNGTFTLTEGRGIAEGDRYKVVVSDYFAEKNKLSIGDCITADFYEDYLKKSDFKVIESKKLEIVGIFHVNANQGDVSSCVECDILENAMFSDLNILQDSYECGFSKSQGEDSKEEDYLSVTFFVKDPKQLDSIIKKVKEQMGSNLEYWEIKKDDTNYKSSIEPLNTMKTIVVVALTIVCGTCIILLSLLSTMWMIERKREISILLSLGKTKAEVLIQFLLEYLLLSTIAVCLAFLIASSVSNKVGNQLLKVVNPKEVTSEEEPSLDVTDYVDETGNVDVYAISEDAVAFEPPSQTPDSIEIIIGAKEFLLVFGIEWAILGISVLRMGNRLWKMKPREIISNLS